MKSTVKTVLRISFDGTWPFSRMRLYSAQHSSEAMWALTTAPQTTARFESGRSLVSLLEIRPSSQAVVIVLSSKSLVSSSVMRLEEGGRRQSGGKPERDGVRRCTHYSTVVRKSPRIDSSLRATTMFLRAVGRSEP